MVGDSCLARLRDALRQVQTWLGAMGDGLAGHGAASVVLRAVAPLALWGPPTLMMANGEPFWGLAAFAGALTVLSRQRWPVHRRALVSIGVGVVLIGALFGLPRAAYNIGTEACLGAATDLIGGDIRSLSDARLSPEDLRWIARARAYLSLGWPAERLPPIDDATLANILVKAPVVVSEIKWRGPNLPVTGLGLWEAKEAYAARHFDRRRVCHLYHTGLPSRSEATANATARHIVATTDAALALILPALQTTYEPAAKIASAAPNGHPPSLN